MLIADDDVRRGIEYLPNKRTVRIQNRGGDHPFVSRDSWTALEGLENLMRALNVSHEVIMHIS